MKEVGYYSLSINCLHSCDIRKMNISTVIHHDSSPSKNIKVVIHKTYVFKFWLYHKVVIGSRTSHFKFPAFISSIPNKKVGLEYM